MRFCIWRSAIKRKRLLAVLALAFVPFALLLGGPPRTGAFIPPGIQDFNLDTVQCLLATYPPDGTSPNPQNGFPQVCGVAEALGIGSAVTRSMAVGLIAGNRLANVYAYNGPGWVMQSDAAIPNGTTVGDIAVAWDFFQDGLLDIVGDDSNCGGPPNQCGTPLNLSNTTPEAYVEQTLAWGPGTGCAGEDESYLSQEVPGAAAMIPYVRYRACIDTVFMMGRYRIDLMPPVPVNLVTFSPNWSPAGTQMGLPVLSGAPYSPTTLPVGKDSPLVSITHTNAPYTSNPAAPGLYALWMAEVSNEDEANRAINFVLTTSCKAIGNPPTQADADADCQPDALEQPGVCNDTGWPTVPATTDPTRMDSDGDGIPDGIEVAWGSGPCRADTDGDGRTDLEEMVGPTQFLSDPTKPDTDGDGVLDGGLKLDLHSIDTNADGCREAGPPDGRPDFPDVNGDGICDTGVQIVNLDPNGTSHVRIGYKIVGSDIKPDNVINGGRDNCPSVANPDQVNTDLDSSTTWGHGDLYGDACDTDDDNDGIVDDAELSFKWDAGAHQCFNVPPLPGTATPLNPLNPDTDGDGVLDGPECEAGSNPADAGDSPGAPRAADDPDKDGVSNAYETFKRTQSFSDQPPPAPVGNEDVDGDTLIGQNDPDSDGDGLSDGCEVYVTGTNPMMPDSDGNGTNDPSEANLTARIATYCGSATDLDGDGVTNDLDNCLFASNADQANTNPAIGNGKGIAGDDATVSWNRVNDKRGDACDGDRDNDGLPNSIDPDPFGDITYDDNGNGNACPPIGTDAADDGPSWDANCNGRLDGREVECAGAFPDMPAGWASADADGDGLNNKWEFCKWGTNPNVVDSDGDGRGDCVEAADVDGDILVDFVSDVIRYAKAILLAPTVFGQDGDFDIDGNNHLDFTGDVIQEAKFALIGTPGKASGICK